MTAVSVSYILFAPNPEGFGLNYNVAVGCGGAVAVLLTVVVLTYIRRINNGKLKRTFDY